MSQSIADMLGINLKSVEYHFQNVWKMAWEQVLLVALYSRENYRIDKSGAFSRRMALIQVIEDVKIKKLNMNKNNEDINYFNKIYSSILVKLEEGCGSNEIIEFLLHDQENDKIRIKKDISEMIEERLIAFRPINKKDAFAYTYYSMYQSIANFTPIIQRLLALKAKDTDDLKQDLDIIIRDYILKSKKFLNVNCINEAIESFNEDYIDNNMDYIEKMLEIESLKNEVIDSFYSLIINGRYEKEEYNNLGLCAYINNVFEELLYKDKEITLNKSDLYKKIYNEEEINFILDKNKLKEAAKLGLINEIISGIDRDIKKIIDDTSAEKKYENSKAKEDFIALSNWYKENKTGLFRKIDQIPKIIAYIMNFDIVNDKYIFSERHGVNNHIKQNKKYFIKLEKPSDRYIYISIIIRYCLYYNCIPMNLWLYGKEDKSSNSFILNHEVKLEDNDDNDDKLEDEKKDNIEYANKKELEIWINKLDKNENELEILDGTIMKGWIDFLDNNDYKKMLDRFKRKPKIIEVMQAHSLVEKQKKIKSSDIENSVEYPYGSSWPLPLWVKNISNIIIEADNILVIDDSGNIN